MSDTNTGRGAGLAGSNGATSTPGANGGPRNTSASAPRTTRDTVLSVRDLRVRFGTKRGVANVVNGISYDLRSAETLAIVGESGSGKSVGVLALLGLLKEPPASVSGSIRYRDRELIGMSPREWRTVRGNRMAMIFQEPMTSLNPVKTGSATRSPRSSCAHRLCFPRPGGAPGRSNARTGSRSRRPPVAARRLSAPAFRRHAPARHDRHGTLPATRRS
jgi:ABC-type oligopeptide transport system ATPase subunit